MEGEEAAKQINTFVKKQMQKGGAKSRVGVEVLHMQVLGPEFRLQMPGPQITRKTLMFPNNSTTDNNSRLLHGVLHP